MSIQSGDLSAHIERVHLAETILRVERDESIQGLGQKERDANRRRKHPRHLPQNEEEPHDVVEVSSDYHSPDTDSDASPAVERTAARALVSPASNHHIDIKV